ncbi:LTA synthase family protein [Cohnella nanjingensis]|uniref:LTA synthase family protein n=1 Tax=Cohnella nanjingensis TaxID=1387779 RepID=A0A7X0RVA5_9BACL|nr:LTA synthase family protein [Cohnella nanjingensis]MBB6672754.1 LTA synthase family protein [Cohnella nanjingensis]
MRASGNPLFFKPVLSRRVPYLYAYAVLLLLKMMLLRHFFFQQIAWTRLAADAAAVLVLLCLLELAVPARWRGTAYWTLNLIVSFILFSSTLYFAHFSSVPTYTALLQLHQVLQIKSSVQSTLDYRYYAYFLDLAVIVVLAVAARVRHGSLDRIASRTRRPVRPGVRRSVAALGIVLCLGISAGYIRSGIPIDNELVAAEQEGFLNYQVASAIKAGKSASEGGNLADAEQEAASLMATYPYRSAKAGAAPAYFGRAAGKNVIVLQLEAFQNFPLHLNLNGQALTPNLNKLADEGFYFPNVYQQIGQGNTSDAEFMSNTSIYPTGKIAMSTGFGDRELPSLPRLLEGQGYEAITLHVNDVTFWDRNQLYPAIGFDRYYDKPSFDNDHFNDFGASDEELYRVGAEKLTALAKAGTPFYAQFVTASSHFPFKVPEGRQRIEVPEAIRGTQLGDYLIAANYTDYAIGTLIDRLKADGLWDDTVIVVYGDHYGLQPDDNDPAKVSEALGIDYDSRISRFNIPFLVHVPGMAQGKRIEQTGGQVDMMPTLANLLGVPLQDGDAPFTAFGHDLLNIDRNVVGSRYYLPTGSFFNDDVLFVPGKGFEDGTAISLKTHKPVADISPYKQDYDYIMQLMGVSDRYVRLLPRR